MIDLEKEREAFEDQWKKNGYFHFNLERKNGEERYSHRHVNFSFKFWCQRAELAQAEINKLKQKLEKFESGEFVLVPKQLSGIKVSDDDTNLIDAEITQQSNELIADLLINNGEEELEMLVAKAMKLGELYERKRWQKSMIEAVEKDHE